MNLQEIKEKRTQRGPVQFTCLTGRRRAIDEPVASLDFVLDLTLVARLVGGREEGGPSAFRFNCVRELLRFVPVSFVSKSTGVSPCDATLFDSLGALDVGSMGSTFVGAFLSPFVVSGSELTAFGDSSPGSFFDVAVA
jgi:hypothetical protein